MIQRIQTVYLLVGALALAALPFFGRIWSGLAAEAHVWFTPAVLALAGLAAVTALAAIFLYADRSRQRKVVVGAQVVTVLLVLALFGGLYLANDLGVRVEGAFSTARFVMLLLPVGAYVLFFLARRAIESDINLVRSMDRLRG